MKEDQRFPREEKLKSRKMIGSIFSEGAVVKSYPLRIQFLFHEFSELPRCQVGVSVSKRNFKSAVDRNRIKRQLREAYRRNKSGLIQNLTENQKHIAMMVIYASNVKPSYEELEALIIKAINKIRM